MPPRSARGRGRRADSSTPRQRGKRKRKRAPQLPSEEAAQLLLRYPPAEGEKDAVEITRGDEARLDEGEFLNDSLIDFYLKCYDNGDVGERQCDSSSSSSAPGTSDAVHGRLHFFSSYFFSKLRSLNRRRQPPSSMQELERWTRGQEVLQKELLFVPINEGLHWSLAVICNPGNVQPPKAAPRHDPSAAASFPAARASGASADSALDVRDGSDGEQMNEQVKGGARQSHSTSETETEDEAQQACRPEARKGKAVVDCRALAASEGGSGTESDRESKSTRGVGDSEVAPVDVGSASAGGNAHQKAPCILFLDSLKYHNESTVRRHVYAFLNHQWQWSHGPGRWKKRECGYLWGREGTAAPDGGGETKPLDVFNSSTMPFICPDVQRQDNSCDCGVFVLQYVEEVVKFVEKRSISQRVVRKRFAGCVLTEFDRGVIRKKRKKLREFVETMNQEQVDAGVKGIVRKPARGEEILHAVPAGGEGGAEDEDTQLAKAMSLSQCDTGAGRLGTSPGAAGAMEVDGGGRAGGVDDELSRALEASRSECAHASNSSDTDGSRAGGTPERLYGGHPGHNQGTVGVVVAGDDQQGVESGPTLVPDPEKAGLVSI